jgi:hypothetical protein
MKLMNLSNDIMLCKFEYFLITNTPHLNNDMKTSVVLCESIEDGKNQIKKE